MTQDDNQLAKRANNGDATAFAMLLERHYDLIYRLAYRMLSSKADAEDVAQDICVSLTKKLKSFHGNAKFSTWLYQVTMNATRDFLRRRATISKIQSDYIEVDALQKAADIDRKCGAEWAYEALATLPQDLRETAMLVVAEGLNHAQAAQILNIKEATVSWRMMKVRDQLKALASAQAGEQHD